MLTWLGALIVGLSLGLLGSGGSILTVPILVYVLGESPKLAVAASLAIVGSIALVGAASYARQRLVDWRYVLAFGLPGIVATYAGAWISHAARPQSPSQSYCRHRRRHRHTQAAAPQAKPPESKANESAFVPLTLKRNSEY